MASDERLSGRIQSRSGSLTASEGRLVSELLRAPREVALLSAASFAERLGVHEATCSRLARKLGFNAYAEFREALQREYLHAEPASRLASTLSEAKGNILAHLVAQEMTSLERLGDHIDNAMIDRAATLIDNRRIFVFAQGNALALAVQAERRLHRMGLDARIVSGSARDMAEEALLIGKADAVLLFAFRRQPPGLAPLLRRALEVGAVSMAISDTLGPSLLPAPDLILAAPRTGMSGSFQTLTVPMLILNALILNLGARRGAKAIQQLESLGTLIARFEGEAPRRT